MENRERGRYPSEVTNEEWAFVAAYLALCREVVKQRKGSKVPAAVDLLSLLLALHATPNDEQYRSPLRYTDIHAGTKDRADHLTTTSPFRTRPYGRRYGEIRAGLPTQGIAFGAPANALFRVRWCKPATVELPPQLRCPPARSGR